MMKSNLFYTTAIFFFSYLFISAAFAQTPDKLSYQAVIRNTSNQLLANKEVGMKISILQGTASGSPVYVEIFNPNPVTNANGLVSVEIGSGIPLSGSFGNIDWSGGPYFIKTETDPDGGTNYTITGTSQLLSVPYALHAKKAEAIVGGESDPAWKASPSSGITQNNISNWNSAFSWGNHANAGYLTGFNESDPLWKASPSFGITQDHISNWESAFNHSNIISGSIHGSTVAGSNLLRLTDPSSVSFLRINADNSVSALNASDFRNAIGAGSGNGTITSITTHDGITGGPINTTGTIGLSGQALALHNLNNNGFIARTAAGMVAARSIATSGNGISISNGDGTGGNPTITLNIGQGATQLAAGNHTHGNITNDGKIGTATGRLITTNHGTLEAMAGTAEGEMLYWNGTVWTKLSPGQNDQTLAFKNGTPTWDRAANHTHGNISDDGQIGAAIGRIITTGLGGTLQAMAGTTEGEMLYWSGTQWVRLAPGIEGQSLVFKDGKPTWWPEASGSNVVVNPTTGRVWMDRNLGASHVATSGTDAGSYGYLYQWGRDGDGHQIRTSNTTNKLSTDNTPGHDRFITVSSSPYDWRDPPNALLWHYGGTNNPCPSGYRVPTQSEWEFEILSWRSENPAGALGSVLKLPMAGYRHAVTADLTNVGTSGAYWTSTFSGGNSVYVYFNNAAPVLKNAGTNTDGNRASGRSVRCIKE